jgi:hypothetical protein
MNITFTSLAFASFILLSSHPSMAGPWVDKYWPVHDGDTKSYSYVFNQTPGEFMMDTRVLSPGQFEIYQHDLVGDSETDYYLQSVTGILLDHITSGSVEIDFHPAATVVNDTVLQNGGSVSTATTVSAFGETLPATITADVSFAGTVVVPAGSFDDCREVDLWMSVPGQGSSLIISEVLAPDVGIIKFTLSDNSWAQMDGGTVGGVDVRTIALGVPKLSIKTPADGQRVAATNNVVPISGSVNSSRANVQVFYQLNTDLWSEAVVAGTNWSGTVTALAGTNMLSAYAMDSLGHTSSVVVVKFQYVATGILGLRTIGKGTLTPNYTNAALEIGKNYSITAKPAAGYAAEGWTGEVNGEIVLSTNKAALTFTMQSNLVLIATFVDVAKPTLTITAPKTGQRWSNDWFTVKGTAKDNGPIAEVRYQLNGGNWVNDAQTTNNWSNWSATVALKPGTNTFRCYVMDAAGNCSGTNSLNVVYVVTATIGLNIVGKGTISGARDGQLLELGRSVSLSAKPASGYVLTNWLVQVDGVTLLSTNKAAPFIMASNLVLTATFADVQRPTLTITAPRSGQRWSNEIFLVSGKVTDNGPVATVLYQLNGEDWMSATSANNWSNWTAQVVLAPGTNTIKAYAVDAAGNHSLTNSQKVFHVLTYWLPDYYGAVAAGNVWIYDGINPDGNQTQFETRIDATQFQITCYSGKNPVRSYTQYVVKEFNSPGAFNPSTGNFTPSSGGFSDYLTLSNSYTLWGEDDDQGSVRVDPPVMITNRLAVGQTVIMVRNLYDSGTYAGQMSFKLQLMEVTNVTVPAGTFTNCIHIRTTETIGGRSSTLDSWAAFKFGTVMQRGIANDPTKLDLVYFRFAPTDSSPPTMTASNPATMLSGLQINPSWSGEQNKAFGFSFSGPAGLTVVIEASTNLVDWVPMQTNALSAEPRSFVDPDSPAFAQRFYRLRVQAAP